MKVEVEEIHGRSKLLDLLPYRILNVACFLVCILDPRSGRCWWKPDLPDRQEGAMREVLLGTLEELQDHLMKAK